MTTAIASCDEDSSGIILLPEKSRIAADVDACHHCRNVRLAVQHGVQWVQSRLLLVRMSANRFRRDKRGLGPSAKYTQNRKVVVWNSSSLPSSRRVDTICESYPCLLFAAHLTVLMIDGIRRVPLRTRTMARHLIFCVLAFAGGMGTTDAGHFFHYHRHPVFAAPVVVYQPAYVVPTVAYSVTHVPVTTVSYATSYYAPLVPTVSAYYGPTVVAPVMYPVPVYVAPVYVAPVYVAPVYSMPVYAAPVYGYGHRVHSHLNVHRNGSYHYHLHVR